MIYNFECLKLFLINESKMFINDLIKLANELNELFKNCDNNIKKELLKNKIKTRNRKITFTDVLTYIFNYSFIDTTKQKIVSDHNFENNVSIDRTTFYKKEKAIPISFYNDIFIKTKLLLNKYLNKNDNDYNVIAVDGTYNNTNIKNDKTLETTLNLGIYDSTNSIPIEIELKGFDNKNKEIEAFIKYINDNKLDEKNFIFVLDRAYFSYDLINFLNKKNIKFVIRIKNNCIYLKNNKTKNICDHKLKDKKIRFIKYEYKQIVTKKDSNYKDVKLEYINECNLITNLDSINYKDQIVNKIYLMRWNIEVFFKLIKSNFKFAVLRTHNKNTIEDYKKKYLVILINLHIIRLIELINEKHYKNKIKKNNKIKNKHKYSVKNNLTLMIDGLKNIIYLIIKQKIDQFKLKSYCECYIIKQLSIINISNPRVSKIPHTKWYVKSYSEFYKYSKIIKSLITNDTKELNKNLKLELKKYKIVE